MITKLIIWLLKCTKFTDEQIITLREYTEYFLITKKEKNDIEKDAMHMEEYKLELDKKISNYEKEQIAWKTFEGGLNNNLNQES